MSFIRTEEHNSGFNSPSKTPDEEKSMHRPKILIVEDELIVATHIKETLEASGYSVTGIAVSGEEAIRQTEEMRSDLVLMDIKLQGQMDGVDAALFIRNRFDIPVIYLTAFGDRALVERVKVTDSFGYMTKPLRIEELVGTIELALHKHVMEKKLKETNEWFSTMFKSIGDAVIAADTEGIVRLINPAAQILTGWKEEEALGRNLKDIFKVVYEKTGDRVEIPVEKVIREGRMLGLTDHVLITKRGNYIPVQYSAAPISNGTNISGIITVFYDNTEHKRTEQEREEIIKNLQEALTKVKMLNGLLPICASCKKIRDENGRWKLIESYFREYFGVEFSHSICPECARRLYPDFYKG